MAVIFESIDFNFRGSHCTIDTPIAGYSAALSGMGEDFRSAVGHLNYIQLWLIVRDFDLGDLEQLSFFFFFLPY